MEKRYNINDLMKVMADLRTPETGCPWDLEQDFKTIIPHTIEEVYEVADAIDRHDMPALREELGDLLFQPVYHAQMASESGHFDLHDVIHDVTAKMIHRHPHVFGDAKANEAADVNVIWDQQKDKEKSSENSVLDNVPKALPALLRASKLQKRAARVGFEWPDISGVIDKMDEETAELKEALQTGNQDHIAEELGDLLFVMANFARMQDLNPEEVLRQACEKFERRFRGVEQELSNQGKKIEECDLPEMEDAWILQKQKERGR